MFDAHAHTHANVNVPDAPFDLEGPFGPSATPRADGTTGRRIGTCRVTDLSPVLDLDDEELNVLMSGALII